MHGLINRSLQSFLRDTYGPALWSRIADAAGVGAEGFEAMLTYEDGVTDRVIGAAAQALAKPREALLEDLGIYLVSLEPLRRLLRFGGVDYVDFLQTVDELPERARLAVADIGLPDLTLDAPEPDQFTLHFDEGHPGFAPVFVGILRAMADDYGAFALVDLDGERQVKVELLQTAYASGRAFDLARPEEA
ncbi:MAG: heme NO-binding domain-containing protein [Paracoccaceae bacterium]|jgi:hypothetical protein